MTYPNGKAWSALRTGTILNEGKKVNLSTISCGELKLPSGKLIVCDPFAGMSKSGNPFVQVPSGEYEVVVTLADVSDELDGSHIREAYASLIIDNSSVETSRKFLELSKNGKPTNQTLKPGEFWGYGVDAGTSCFADAETVENDMPDEDTWYEGLFENDSEECWFNLMDDKNLVRGGIANIKLPLTKNDNNLILFHSGWGDGFYPVFGGFDVEGKLVAVHTDFDVVVPPKDEIEELSESPTKPWWKIWA
jgi:hypothetical protein